ncbi:MAG: glycosyltransferase family 2 protein [Gammaproteobacteria bacterium]|nr:MAG: glycosyltransferase family 2 protein [Gammaproteobacteria bacterium]
MARKTQREAAYAEQYANCCVVIPARNEEDSIASVIQQIQATCTIDLVVVDDNSSDETKSIARNAGATVLSLPVNLGAWGATQTGLRYAQSKGYHFVVTMDADGQHEAEHIEALLEPIFTGTCDVSIGTCVTRGSLLRKIAWFAMKRVSGLSLEDITSGFRVYNQNAIAVLTTREATLLEYQDVGVLTLLHSYGIRFAEIEVNMQKRQNGPSRIFCSWLAVAYYMCHTAILGMSKRQYGKKGRKKAENITPLNYQDF